PGRRWAVAAWHGAALGARAGRGAHRESDDDLEGIQPAGGRRVAAAEPRPAHDGHGWPQDAGEPRATHEAARTAGCAAGDGRAPARTHREGTDRTGQAHLGARRWLSM